MNVRFVTTISTLIILSSGTIYAGGTLTGKVTFRGKPPATRPTAVVNDNDRCGTSQPNESFLVSPLNEVRNVVIHLEGKVAGGQVLDPTKVSVLDQKGCRFEPHVVFVPQGGTLTVTNSDHLLHNIQTEGRSNRPVYLKQDKQGDPLKISFMRPEILRISCSFHRWMSAWVAVMDHPYYTLTNTSGDYTLTDIPAGGYLITSWHEALGSLHRRVLIREGQTSKIDFGYISK